MAVFIGATKNKTYLHVTSGKGGNKSYFMSVYKDMNLGGTIINKKMFDYYKSKPNSVVIRHK